MLEINLRFNLEYVAVRRQVIAASTTWPAFPLRAGHGESVLCAVVRAWFTLQKAQQAHHEVRGSKSSP
ncbi:MULTISPECIES: hypothetical protein [Pseudomonadota]|uniref:hypothetical protein n=1 Tax=Pseudomonadota TaxID=1224 RepID=UPI0013D95507|nr:hypothetical protein [Serratia marcescens]MBN9136343.1 hypothetical protein [Phyllobacterium sp.]MBQ9349720.1 hypothetical protein [Phyllobacterium sp.]